MKRRNRDPLTQPTTIRTRQRTGTRASAAQDIWTTIARWPVVMSIICKWFSIMLMEGSSVYPAGSTRYQVSQCASDCSPDNQNTWSPRVNSHPSFLTLTSSPGVKYPTPLFHLYRPTADHQSRELEVAKVFFLHPPSPSSHQQSVYYHHHRQIAGTSNTLIHTLWGDSTRDHYQSLVFQGLNSNSHCPHLDQCSYHHQPSVIDPRLTQPPLTEREDHPLLHWLARE